MTEPELFPIADLHCDTVVAMRRGYDIGKRHSSYHVDIPRLREGGINIQVFATSCLASGQDESAKDQVNAQLELLQSEFAKNKDSIEICRTASDIERATSGGKIAAVLAIEGGQALDNDISNIEYFYDKGVRIITIAHEASVGWCANWKETGGLTDLGREMIREMNRLGIIIDLSHSSDATVGEVLKISSSPVIASHSNARALCNHKRNLTNEQIKGIAETGGVIGVTFVNNFISEEYNAAYDEFWQTVPSELLRKLLRLYTSAVPDDEYQQKLNDEFSYIIEGERQFQHLRVSIRDVADQIDYLVNLVGPDHIAIGSDFDGMSSTPIGLENCSKITAIGLELLNRNYNEKDIRKILRENFIRVFKQAG